MLSDFCVVASTWRRSELVSQGPPGALRMRIKVISATRNSVGIIQSKRRIMKVVISHPSKLCTIEELGIAGDSAIPGVADRPSSALCWTLLDALSSAGSSAVSM